MVLSTIVSIITVSNFLEFCEYYFDDITDPIDDIMLTVMLFVQNFRITYWEKNKNNQFLFGCYLLDNVLVNKYEKFQNFRMKFAWWKHKLKKGLKWSLHISLLINIHYICTVFYNLSIVLIVSSKYVTYHNYLSFLFFSLMSSKSKSQKVVLKFMFCFWILHKNSGIYHERWNYC